MAKQVSGVFAGNLNQISNREIVRALLIACIFTISGIFVLAYRFSAVDPINLAKGEVAPQTILAPEQITYTSAIETELARERARNSVPVQYTPPNPNVARKQVMRLREIFDYMETVRADPYGSLSEKFEWIDAVPDINVSDTEIDEILIMNDEDWQTTRKESIRLLDNVMREEIKETQVFARRRELPNKVAFDIPQSQADVIVALTSDLIKANTFSDDVRTEEKRQEAADAVEPVVVSIEKNEMVIPAGRVVGARELEKLEALGLQQPQYTWLQIIAMPTVIMVLTTTLLSVHIVQYTPKLIVNTKRVALLAFLVLTFLVIAKLLMPNGTTLPYFFPVASLAMMIAILVNSQLSFLITSAVAFLAGYIATETPELIVIYLIISGWTGVLALGRRHRVNNLLWAGLYVSLVNASIISVYSLTQDPAMGTLFDTGQLMLVGVLNGIFSAGFTLIGLFAIGNMFRITTSIQLIDLGRPTQPLLRQLLLKAPGTYHHSLMVSNLAEQAAERIGANSLLVRVMAYYHDIGKMQRPYFFIENQPDGMENVHEKLDPQISAKIIISHVTDGLDLAKKYRLPPAIRDGIAQHQGTGLVRFFYYQACEQAKEKEQEVNEALFRYPGPKPQTRETGILMLADVSETTIRALKPRSAAEIDEIVQKSIAHHLDTGQLDECDLTISDLHKIRTAFVDILQGIHHPRIKYPDQVKEEEEKAKQAKKERQSQIGQPSPSAETSGGDSSKPLKPVPSQPPGPLVQQE